MSCSNSKNSVFPTPKPDIEFYTSTYLDFSSYPHCLYFKLTKENFFSQVENMEKENCYKLIWDVVYSYGNGKDFIGDKKEADLTFPKENYQNYSELRGKRKPYFTIDVKTNYTQLFSEYDFIILGFKDHFSYVIDEGTFIVEPYIFTTPYVFKDNILKPKSCYEAYCLFYNPDEEMDEMTYIKGEETDEGLFEQIEEHYETEESFFESVDFISWYCDPNTD